MSKFGNKQCATFDENFSFSPRSTFKTAGVRCDRQYQPAPAEITALSRWSHAVWQIVQTTEFRVRRAIIGPACAALMLRSEDICVRVLYIKSEKLIFG